MVGIFDSGMGGAFALAELKRLRPDADVAFFADRRNAPYGIRTREMLIELVKRDVDLLRTYGVRKILIACCTASTVYRDLSEEYRTGVIPIIDATACAAVMESESKRIAVLATEATVRSCAFERAVYSYCRSAQVVSYAAQELVAAIEHGSEVDGILDEAYAHFDGADTVILGCTHFAAVEKQIKRKGFATVNSARIGARLLSEQIGTGDGTTLYINE